MKKKDIEIITEELRTVATSLSKIAGVFDNSGTDRSTPSLPPTKLNDGLDDEDTLDEDGDPVEMPKAEKDSLTEQRYKDGLEAIQNPHGSESDVEKEEEPATSAPSPVSLEDVRKKLIALAHEGRADEIRTVLKKFNALKLSEVDEADYPALLDEIEKFGGKDAE